MLVSEPRWTTAALIKAFFDFYGNAFAFEEECASVRLGQRCLHLQQAPLTSDTVASSSKRSRLAVEDPVETNWDLGQILDEERSSRVCAEFKRGSVILSQSGMPIAQRLEQLLSACEL